MKSLQELIVGTDEITGALFATVISDKLVKAAEAKLIGRELVQVNTELVGKPGHVLDFPKMTTVDFSTHTQGSSLTTTQPTFSTVEIAPILMSCGIRITNEAIEASRFDVIQTQLQGLADAAARMENVEIIRAVMNMTIGTWEVTADGSTATFTMTGASNIVQVVSVLVGGVSSTIDYYIDHFDGAIKFSSNPASVAVISVSYYSVPTLNMVEAISSTVLNYDDILSAKAYVDGNSYYADVVAIHPNELADLLNSQKFIDASYYGSNEGQMRGEIGMIAGLKVLVSTAVPQGSAVVLDSKNAAVLVVKRGLKIATQDVPGADAVEVIATMKYAAGIINDEAICVITGAQTLDFRN